MTKSEKAGQFAEAQANSEDRPVDAGHKEQPRSGEQTIEQRPGEPGEGLTSSENVLPDEGVAPVSGTKPGPAAEALQRDLAAAQAQRDEYLTGWQRSQAEFSNYKRRIEREREQLQQVLTGNVVKRYLEVVDDLERALKNRPSDGDGAAWADGIELVYRKLIYALEVEGVKPMQVKGQFFDPTRHEAIGQEEADGFESGQVIDIVQNGYVIGERVLRPALVKIAR